MLARREPAARHLEGEQDPLIQQQLIHKLMRIPVSIYYSIVSLDFIYYSQL
jgi:hypothetical protein